MPKLPINPASPWLAPLAGWSDLHFRLLCREYGAVVCCTEMISAKGLVYGGRNTLEILKTTPEDAPLVAQLFGSEPAFLAQAVQILREQGFTAFDLNMGCSVPKVTKTGSGAAMLRDFANSLACAKAMLEAAGPWPVGFKLRLGWDDAGREEYLRFGIALAEAGAAWLTLHSRTAKQGFSGQSNSVCLRRLVREVEIPVIASGDLLTPEDAVRIMAESGASGLMFGRGALRCPAIFRQYGHLRENGHYAPLDRPELGRMIQRQIELAREHAPGTALLKMRTYLPRYIKSLDHARALRQQIIASRDWVQLEQAVQSLLETYDL